MHDGSPDQSAPHWHSDPAHGSGDAPHGWYYYGPRPPWENGADPAPDPGPDRSPEEAADYADVMGAFESLSRGEFTAETFAKLFNLKDMDFWKGAMVGAAAALALSNLPQLKAMMAMMAASAQPPSPAQTPGEDDLDQSDDDDKET